MLMKQGRSWKAELERWEQLFQHRELVPTFPSLIQAWEEGTRGGSSSPLIESIAIPKYLL